MAPVVVQVSFRGKPQHVEGLDSKTRIAQLKEKLEELTTVPVTHQKLILKGKVLQSDEVTLEDAGIVSKSLGAEVDEILTQAARLMLVGSTPAEVQVVHELKEDVVVRNDLHGKVVPKGYKKVSLNLPSDRPAHWQYRFQRIETLPGLPEEDKARDILESLANDPGVCSVLEKHRWTVGALCELYPEGKVGVSRECVMGLNQNHGQKILLRLRTDDLKGFRKILSIRKVLFHELAHNEFSDHDDKFYRLMRQVEREAAELDWRQQSGRTLVGGEPRPRAELVENERGYMLVKEAFEGGSGRLGGYSEGLTHMFSAQQLAGQAAILRLTPEEQEVEDCCGHTKGNESAAAAADAERAATALPAEMGESEPAHRVKEEEMGELDENEANRSALDHLGVAEPSGSVPKTPGLSPAVVATDAAADPTIHCNNVGDTEEGQHIGCAGLSVAVNCGGEEVGVDGSHGTMPEGMTIETAHEDADPVTSSTLKSQHGDRDREEGVSVEAIGSSSASSEIPTAMDVEEDAPQMIPQTASSLLDELVAMGFARDDAQKALAASGGSIPDATDRLLTPGVSDAVVVGRNGPGDETLGSAGGRGGGEGPRLPRDVRVQQAAERIAGLDDRSRAIKCLQVLEVMLRNIMENPAEEKFRRVRRSNRKFKASVGSVPGAVELLLAAGFEVRGTDRLELGRQDTGLIWLARSTVEGWRERLAVGMHAKSIM